jgi:CheY-like chemotaxis protein
MTHDNKLVLIVDDTPTNVGVISGVLKGAYRTKVATNGEKALVLATAAEKPDLILLDVMMPQMDGWEMLRRVQEQHGGAIPVVMFSGQVDENAAGEAAERGASAFVGKPFDPQQLLDRAKQILGARPV